MTLLIAAALLLGAPGANGADTIKALVGHMCCGACKDAATAGVKTLDWVDTVTIENDAVTVTAKADQKADLVALTGALRKAGFPAREITVSGPVTFTLAHLCCAGCVNDLRTKVGNIRSEVLDKEKVSVDASAKTIMLQPKAGQSMNVVALMTQLERAGFSVSRGSIAAGAAAAAK